MDGWGCAILALEVVPKNLFYKILCLLFQQGNYASLIDQVKMASILWQVAYQLIMKYCSKFLVSSICQSIFITHIKKFTIVNILG